MRKSYTLLRVLNRGYPRWVRTAAAWSARVWCRYCIGDRIVGRWASSWFTEGDFKQGARVAAWCGRMWAPRWRVWRDPFFDFTEGADKDILSRLSNVLVASRGHADEGVVRGDELFIEARRGHLLLENGAERAQFSAWYDRFEQRANAVLEVVECRPVGSETLKGDKSKEREGDFRKEDGAQALRDFARLLPLPEWRWYVVSGTFLGIVREGGFLGHDYDIDLGVDGDEIDIAEIKARFSASAEFVLKKVDAHVEVRFDADALPSVSVRPSLIKLVHRTGINVDVFVHYRDGDVVWHGSVIHRWDNSPFRLTQYELEGVRVLGPEDADRYLTENYGDWRTPVKEFDCTTGTPNLVISRNFLSVALFLKRLEYFSRHDKEQFRKLRATLVANRIIREQSAGLKLQSLQQVWAERDESEAACDALRSGARHAQGRHRPERVLG